MKRKLSLVLLSILCVTSANAMQFQTLGYKSVAMGGAAVASSSGSVATYNNPALLAKSTYDVEISLSAGVSAYDHGAGASFKNLDDSGFIDTMNKANTDLSSLTLEDRANLINGQKVIIGMDGTALNILPQAHFAVQIKSFGIGVFGSSEIVGIANVDQTHDQLYFTDGTQTYDIDGNVIDPTQATYNAESMQYALENGLTYVQSIGIILSEVPVAYGHKFEFSGGNFMLGGALKYMQATTYTEQLKIDNSGKDNTSEKLDKQSSNFGVDLGLAYEPSFAPDLTLAVVAKDLNSPEFEFVDGSKYKVEPMYRAGIAYDILESLEVAIDVDLSTNKTFIEAVDSQMVGGGLNWHPTSWFALRGGAMSNLDADDKAGTIYTAGLGIGAKWFQIDLSGQMSPKTTTVNGTDYPQYAKVNLALISRW